MQDGKIGILYKGSFARSRRCSRRQQVENANSGTSVAVHQCAANCLDEDAWCMSMGTMCLSYHFDVTVRGPLSDFQVVRSSPVHCFQARIILMVLRCTGTAIA